LSAVSGAIAPESADKGGSVPLCAGAGAKVIHRLNMDG
jgi:hypothetical protein